jgi:hypothetical protein
MKDLFTDIDLATGAIAEGGSTLVVVFDDQLIPEPAPAPIVERTRKAKTARPRSRAIHKRRKKKAEAKAAKPRVVWVDRPKFEPLTPAEVDPEFKGSAVDWTDKYGHVQALTGEQYAADRFNAWASNLRILVKAAKNAPGWPVVDHDWLRNPSPHFIGKMAEALDHLRPIIAEAEALLARAKTAEAAKRQEPRPPDDESLPTG